MSDEIVDNLIQRVLDGEGTPEEARRLEARLASDPLVRERHAELKQVFDGLAAVELENAPAGLHGEIMAAVRATAGARTPAAPVVTPRRMRRPTDFMRLLLPVAAGFIAGAMAWATYTGSLGPAAPPSDLSGAMADLAQPVPMLSLGGVEAGVAVSAGRAEKGATVLELYSGKSPVRVWLVSENQGVLLAAEPSAGATAIEGAEGVVAVDLQPKTLLRVRCTPQHTAQSVRITVQQESGSVTEGVLRLEWLPWARRTRN